MAFIETLIRLRARIRRVGSNLPIYNALFLRCNAWSHTSTRKKRDNHFIRENNFTISSILTKFSAFKLSSLRPYGREFKRQTICQWRGTENCCDEVSQRIVNRILRGRDISSHSKVEHCYWEKRWLCWEVGIRSIEDKLHFDVWYVFLCR